MQNLLSTTGEHEGEKQVIPIPLTIYGCERDEAAAFRKLSPSFGVSPQLISDPVSEANARFARSRCISVGHKSEVSKSVIYALRSTGVRYISTRSVGLNHIDTAAAEHAGITVGNAPYSPGSVADHCLMLMLMALRGAKSIVRSVEKHDYRLSTVRGKALHDMTVGVFGTGRIGTAVIERLRGFGCKALACDRNQSPETLLRNSDIITLHMPLCADTRHIIGREQISKMKQGAILINTGRGALVDTGALIDALESGKLGGAALDVVEGEEGIFYFDYSLKPIAHTFLLKLQAMPNVIITPHTAYYTEQALRDIALITLQNCLNYERSLAND
jgi:D-specific alpha-keto acid dehydrogenase